MLHCAIVFCLLSHLLLLTVTLLLVVVPRVQQLFYLSSADIKSASYCTPTDNNYLYRELLSEMLLNLHHRFWDILVSWKSASNLLGVAWYVPNHPKLEALIIYPLLLKITPTPTFCPVASFPIPINVPICFSAGLGLDAKFGKASKKTSH